MGYYESSGEPKGQVADYRRALSDGRGIHIRVYSDHLTAHWDRKDPSTNPIGHLLQDAPGWAIALGLAGLALLDMLEN